MGAAKCRYCRQVLSHLKESTSNLKRHMDRKHPTVPLQRSNQPSISDSQFDAGSEGTSAQTNVRGKEDFFLNPLNQ